MEISHLVPQEMDIVYLETYLLATIWRKAKFNPYIIAILAQLHMR